MDEPTIPEMLRALQRDVHAMRAAQETYVTREILNLRLDAMAKDQAEDRARLDRMGGILWSAFLGPVIVGVILYFIFGGKS